MSADFAALKADVDGILGRTPNDVVYEQVTADINARLRVLKMEATTTLTHVSTGIDLPDDFLSIVSVYIDEDPRRPLHPRTIQQFHAYYEDDGNPNYYALADDVLFVDGSTTEDIELRYIAKLSDLSADGDTNVILDNWPSIYLYGAMYYHAINVRDAEGAAAFERQYEKAMATCRTQDRRDRQSGSPYVPRRRGMVP